MNTRRPTLQARPRLEILDGRLAPSSFLAPAALAHAAPAAVAHGGSGYVRPGAPIPGHPGKVFGGLSVAPPISGHIWY